LTKDGDLALSVVSQTPDVLFSDLKVILLFIYVFMYLFIYLFDNTPLNMNSCHFTRLNGFWDWFGIL